MSTAIQNKPNTHPTESCAICKTPCSKNCARCKQIFYCSIECQKADWANHKLDCSKLREKINSDQPGSSSQNETNSNSVSSATHHLRTTEETKGEEIPKKNEGTLETPTLRSLPATNLKTLMTQLLLTHPEPNVFGKFGIGKIPGIRILEEELTIDLRNPNDCSNFVFGKETWYEKGNKTLTSTLFNLNSKVLDFLKGKGYEETSNPKIGDIIIYSTNFYGIPPKLQKNHKVSHFGKISKINQDGTITVHSKFGHYHTYEHRLELIPYYFGSSYFFITRNENSKDSSEQ